MTIRKEGMVARLHTVFRGNNDVTRPQKNYLSSVVDFVRFPISIQIRNKILPKEKMPF